MKKKKLILKQTSLAFYTHVRLEFYKPGKILQYSKICYDFRNQQTTQGVTELFLVRIFLYSFGIQENTNQK